MEYLSTRGGSKVSAATAIEEGLAPDGGLYVPERFPVYPIAGIANKSYVEIAAGIFALFLQDFSPEHMAQLAVDAYLSAFPKEVAPCVMVGDKTILELWHGPTSAFKDMALQVLPRFMTMINDNENNEKELVILVATSGDTGKAALEGFKDVPGTKIIVFYPKGGVSAIQELQMRTTDGNNTYVVGVDGNFDDCQSGVKTLFSDAELNVMLSTNGKQFSSANSINWGRLLPQIVYYYYAYGRMCKNGTVEAGAPIDIAVPTGNFGNILAAWYAWKMGLPVHMLICASNENDVLTSVIKTGVYDRRRPLYKTTSPSMDILVSSNFERFVLDLSGGNVVLTAKLFQELQTVGNFCLDQSLLSKLQEVLSGDTADSKEAAATIKQVYQQFNYVLDPHTAVGYAVAKKYQAAKGSEYPLLLVSTASPYKFPQAVLAALG
ncbi:MAG: threonine synthase, partial [Clostridiales bacterium]